MEVIFWHIDKPKPYLRNARKIPEKAIAKVAQSLAEFGWKQPLVVDPQGVIIVGHTRLLAAKRLGWNEVPVLVAHDLTPAQVKAYRLMDNRSHDETDWDLDILGLELQDLSLESIDMELTGFDLPEIERSLLHGLDDAAADACPEAPADPVTRPGDLWLVGPHRILCGDCRDVAAVSKLFDGKQANVVVTSPPYATQREYDPSSGFQPVPPDDYVGWYRDVAAAIASVIAPDGSYMLNIKEHAEGGQRHLYVKDLFIAHVRQWGWRFIDEFCWRKTDNGVPGGWNNRFKNAWEPIAHFSRGESIKFHPFAVGHRSEDCFEYSPNNPKSASGSGLLGTGARGAAAGKAGSRDEDGRVEGIARPSNVIEAKSESSQGNHSAPFPRAIPEFFIKAFTDTGDVVFDPFLGSGTTIAAAHVLNRVGVGTEISPAYCDVVLSRLAALTGEEPVLAESGRPFAAVSVERGVGLSNQKSASSRKQ